MRVKLVIINILILFILLYISIFNFIEFNISNFLILFINGIKVMFILNCIFVLGKYKLKKFTIGCLFIGTAWFWNFVKLLFAITNDHLDIILYNTFSLLGIVLMIYGILKTLIIKKDLIDKLKSIAFYDKVTNLPNKNFILKSCPINGGAINCEEEVCECKNRAFMIDDHKSKAIIYIDIDDFKYINDNLGYFYGDILLEQVANRLKTIIGSDDVIVHITGDEFLVFITNKDSYENIEITTSSILEKMNTSYKLINKDIEITCSIGVAKYPIDGKSIEKVLQKANIAMHEAKRNNKSSYVIYNQALKQQSIIQFDLRNELKISIKNDDFIVYYQSKANTITNEITGLEALVRWNHPKRGMVYPNDFIPIAEESGLIKDIDIIVLRIACEQIITWIKNGVKPYNISVNISPIFFNDEMFIETLDNIIATFEIDPSYISIEITENIAIKNVTKTKEKLHKLKSRNIKVYMDDFGKGYSSLSYIKEFEIDYIKIDKTFIDGITDEHFSLELVKTVVNISKHLGFKVVSEGVELFEQLSILKKIGCHEYQGYLLNKPQPIETMELFNYVVNS